MIFLACAITVAVETPFLLLCGVRGKYCAVIIVCVNIVTNLLLNLFVSLVLPSPGAWALLLEAAVVGVEYAVYAAAFGRSARLFALTLAANLLSYAAGIIIF